MHWLFGLIPNLINTIYPSSSGAIHALWTFPAIVLLALVISLGADSAQYYISQGLALAILAWMQTAPEFMVEADLAWHKEVHLLLANLTGSLRLLTGLGLPLVFFVSYLYHGRGGKNTTIHIDSAHSIEVVSFTAGVLYLVVVYVKGSLTMLDGILLLLLYLIYLFFLTRLPSREKGEPAKMEYVPGKIMHMSRWYRSASILALFVIGGVGLILVVGPFINSMKGVAVAVGVSDFVFIQWLSPFLSEFPEKLSAFMWTKKEEGTTMGLMNIVSSTVNQLTLLPALLPFIYAYAVGSVTPIQFGAHQRSEILLTIAQCSTTIVLLVDMKFSSYEAGGLFIIWCIQFFVPAARTIVTMIFFLWTLTEIGLIVLKVKGVDSVENFIGTYKRYIKT